MTTSSSATATSMRVTGKITAAASGNDIIDGGDGNDTVSYAASVKAVDASLPQAGLPARAATR